MIKIQTESSEIEFLCAVTIRTISFSSIGTIDVALNVLPIIFISFAIGLMNELSDRLSLLCETSKNDEPGTSNSKIEPEDVEELKQCVKIHIKIIEIKKSTTTFRR